MAVRVFDGADDEIRFGGTALESLTGALTIALLMKRGNTAAWNALVAGHTSGNVGRWGFEINNSDIPVMYVAGTGSGNGTYTSTTTWNLLVMTKAAGTVAPRFHIRDIATGTWTRSNGGGTLGDPVAIGASGTIRIGEFEDGDDFNGRLALAGIWSTALSDAQVDALGTSLNTNNWTGHAVAPVAVWQFNQATATSVPDLIGSANSTVVNGTSVATGDDPPGWTFAGAGGDINYTAAVAAATGAGLQPSPGVAPNVLPASATALAPTPTVGLPGVLRRNVTVTISA